MKIIVPFQRNLQSVRTQVEQALHTLPWADSMMAELRLKIEEAIEVSYEVEMARAPVRIGVACFPHPDDESDEAVAGR